MSIIVQILYFWVLASLGFATLLVLILGVGALRSIPTVQSGRNPFAQPQHPAEEGESLTFNLEPLTNK